MFARSLALALLLAGTAAASAATDDELRSQLVGRWGETAECAGSVLTFNADGTFVSSGGGDASGDRSGSFQITGGKLMGKAGDTTMPEVTVSFDADKLLLQGDSGDPDTLFKCK
jgi:hypothetical protein